MYARQSLARPLRLLGVWAHPDDESYLSAALMRRVVDRGGHVTVVTATRGDLGSPDTPPAALAAQREGELRSAMAALGVTDVRLLTHADGACSEADPLHAAEPIVSVMHEVQPDLVVTFGSDGITGHPDHAAVGRWATAAWLAHGLGRLRYAAMPASFARRHRRLHERIGMAMDGPLRPTPDHEVAFAVVPTPAEREAKRAALAAHASQVSGLVALMGQDAFDAWWVDEWFRRPTPAELRAMAVAA